MEDQESQSQVPHPLDIQARRSRHRAVAVWARDILVSLAVAFFVITFLYQPVRVEGTSMLPRLHDQDRIFINKFVYHFENINRGDVVVFYYPRDPAKSYIKRVIALPGDRLEVDEGRVYVNGVRIPEPYVPQRFRDVRSVSPIVLPPHCYYVMGEHRSISNDSLNG